MAPRIAIIGAGPAGCTLARILLHKYNIRSTIYERDTDRHQKTQGGTLDLHEDGGLDAVREAGLWDEFLKHARYEGQDFILMDKNGNRALEFITPEGQEHDENQRPEIDRTILRDILLDSLPAETVQWDKNVRSVEKGKLTFLDGEEAGFDLIVGADGAWSKVRPHLTYIKPFYAGITGVELRYRDVDAKHPDLSKLVGRGTCFAFGDGGKAIVAQRNGDGSLKNYAFLSRPESWAQDSGINFADGDSVRKALLEAFSDFGPQLTSLLERCDDDVRVWPLYMLVPGLTWPHRSEFTLIGDAAHVMTPFAGEGVNSAMWDALALARAIGEDPAKIPEAIATYEEQMFKNAKEKTTETFNNMLLMVLDKNGLANMKQMMESHGPPPDA